jgi:FkbM family methyltransferase
MRTEEESLECLKSLGAKPNTVVDVGVAHHTNFLYKSFPDAYYYLFEPLEEFRKGIEKILLTLKGEYHPYAVSNEDGKCFIDVKEKFPGGSLICEENSKNAREVDKICLDSFFKNKEISTPLMIKTDCQGFDLNSLVGSKEVLKRTDIVMVESTFQTNHTKRTVNLPSLEVKDFDCTEIIYFMRDQGFKLFDILSPIYRPSDSALGQVDLIFLKSTNKIIKYGKW